MTRSTAGTVKAVRKAPARSPGKASVPVATIWTLNVKLAFGLYTKGPWEAALEMDSRAPLDELHWAIQKAVKFHNDHPYAFYVARTWRSRRDIMYSDQDDDAPLDTTLAELFPLPPDRKLFYWFNFGDDWRFSITRTRASAQVPARGRKYPRIVSTGGMMPVQYPSVDSLEEEEWFPYSLR